MKVIPESTKDIVAIISHEFKTFGGGKRGNGNPIADALADGKPIFVAGVDVEQVVNRVIQLSKQIQ